MDKTQIQVLLIEDNPVDVIFLREALGADALHSFDLTTVERLSTATEILQTNTFDIILLDLGLPDAQGLSTFEYIHELTPQTPKVILSGLTNEALALQAMQAGAQDYLVKGTAGFAAAPRAIRYAIERQQAQQAMRTSEERFRTMIENGLDDISLLDVHGNLLWESPAVIRNLGYPPNAFVGKNIFAIAHPDDRIWMDELYTKLVQTPGSRQNGTFRMQRADGTWRWVESIATNMLENPSVQAIVVNYRDITDRKSAEDNFKAIFDRAGEGIFQSTPEGRFINVNPAMARIYGYASPEEMITSIRSIAEQIYVDAIDRIQFTTLFQNNISVENFEMKNRRKDGTIIWTSTTARAVRDIDEKLLYYEGFVQDITERKQTEEKLKYQANLLANIDDAVLAVDNQYRITTWNHAAEVVYGWRAEEVLGRDGREIIRTQYREAELKEQFETLISTGELHIEAINQRKNGEPFWVDTRSSLLHGRNGEIEGVVSVNRDITEKKRAEAALHESQARYRLISENSTDVIWTLDLATQRFTYVSPAVFRLRGLTPDEVMAEPMQAAMTPASYQQIMTKLPERIQAFQAGDEKALSNIVEIDQIRKDGSIVPTEVVTTLLADDQRNIIGVLGVTRDITERKLAEAALQASNHRYHGIFDGVQDAIFVESLDGAILDVNRRACEIYGYSHAEFITKKILDIVPSEDFLIRLWDEENISIDHSYETINVRANGEHFPVEIRGGFFEFDGSKLFLVVLRDITERKQADQALLHSEEKFRSLIKQSTDGIVLIDEEGLIIEWNAAETNITGIPLEEAIGQPFWQIQYRILQAERRAKTNPEHFKKAFLESLRNGTFDQLGKVTDVEIEAVTGEHKFIQQTSFTIKTEKGFRLGGIVRDVTERKQAEIELQHRNDDLKLVNTINEAVIHGDNLNVIMDLLAKEMKRIFASDGCTLYTLDSSGNFLNMQKFVMAPERLRQLERMIGSTIPLIQIPVVEGSYFQKILSQNRGLMLNDPQTIQAWMAEFAETTFLPPRARTLILKLIPQIYHLINVRSVVTVPLIADGKTLGVMDVSSAQQFTDDDLRRIENISGQLTAAILRQQANEKVLKSEGFLQSVQNALSAHIAILDHTGNIVQVNAAWRKFGEQNGLTDPNYGIGTNYLTICDNTSGSAQQSARLIAATTRKILAGELDHAQIEYTGHSPVERRWFLLQITSFNDGEQRFAVLAHENISERKLTEETLKETSEQFRTLFEASPEAILLIDPQNDWRIVDCNATSCLMNGYTREELIGQSIDLLNVKPGISDERAAYLERVRAAGVLHYEVYHRRKNGTVFPIEVSTSLITLGGREMVLGIDRDITERRRAEENLRESEALYRLAMEVAGAVPYRESYYDNGKRIKYEFIGEGIRQLTGYGPDEFTGKVWDSLVEEVNLVEELAGYSQAEAIQLVREGKSPVWKCEHRIRDRAGNIHWVFEAAIELRDEHGISHGSIGTYQDITARKQAENALRESEEKYRTFFQSSLDAILITAPNGLIQSANPAACTMLGRTEAEICALGRDGIVDTTDPRLAVLLEERAKHGKVYGELTMFRSDGSAFPVEMSSAFFQDSQGNNLTSMVIREISERKQIQNELQQSEQRYRALFEDMPLATWEEDFSEVKKYLAALQDSGITDLHAYFLAHPEAVQAGSDKFKILDVNNAALQLFKANSKAELIEGTYREMSPGEREHGMDDLLAIAAGKTSNQWEGFDTTLTGEPIEITLNWSVVPGYEADYSKVIITTVDITQRKQAENELRHSHSLLNATFESTADGILVVGSNGKIFSFNQKFLNLWQIPYTLAERKDDQELLEFVLCQLKDPSTFIDRVESLYQTPGEVSFDELEFIDGRIFERYSQPQHLGDAVIGRVWSFRDVTARKQAEKELRESEARFASIFHTNPTRVSITSYETGRFLDVNEAFLAASGYTREEVLSKTSQELSDWVDPAAREHFRTLLQEQGHVHNFETQLRQKSGALLETLISAELIELFGERCILSVGLDITERKKAENDLRISEERFRQLADNIQEVFWISDAITGEDIYISPAGEKIWAHSIKDLMSVPDIFINTILPEDRPKVLQMNALQRSGQSTEMEYRIQKPDGSIIWVWDRAFPIFDGSGKLIRLAGIAADITERKKTEALIQETNEKLARAQSIAHIGSWETHVPTGELQWSDEMYRVMGLPLSRPLNLTDALRVFPPTELERFQTALANTMNEGVPYSMDYRIVQPDGTTRYIHDEGEVTRDEHGVPLWMHGTTQDITDRKNAEVDIQRHLAELQALYENGLAVGRLLKPNEIGERIITTFAEHLSWHHVAIRIKDPESDNLHLIAFNQQGLNSLEKEAAELHLNSMISKVGHGLSGWVVETGQAFRTGNVHAQARYVNTYPGIQSGLYMPLKIGETCIGVISVESEKLDAFTEQDERLLATLATQTAIAFENARLYQSVQQELQERKRIANELRLSEAHYRELADSITDVFFEMDQTLHYSYWNKASELLTRIPADNAIGKGMHEIFGQSEEQSRLEQIYLDVLAQHHSRTFETLFIVNHQERIFEVNAYPSSHGVSVVAKDITERKRSEIILQKRFELMEFAANNPLEAVMNNAINEVSGLTDSVIGFFHIINADQATPDMQIWNLNTHQLFDVPESEGLHRSAEQAGVWADALRQRRAIIYNTYTDLPHKKNLPTGHAALTRLMVFPIIRNEKIMAVVGVGNKPEDYTQQDLEIAERFADYAWDVTERKQMEHALAEERKQLAQRVEDRTADLSRANSNLARALRVKDEFLANMSHELRTPLNAILGLSESLAEQTAGPLNEKQQKYINTVSESGHHLLSLINDILDLAKIEAGQITLETNKVDIHSVCDASLRMIKQLAKKKNQDVDLEIDPRLRLMWADERRLKQMLVNLLSNAVKFTPDGGKLGLEVQGDEEENKITFTIWDTGIGIKTEDLTRLFKPFVQLDAGLARESSGTGLGLALVAQMAALHGGSASVTSEYGQGSRFQLMLPWEPSLEVDAVERLKITGKFRPIRFAQQRKPIILLIEDTEEVIMMISDYLEMNGLQTIIARDGVEGFAQAQRVHPDLILMDIQMPRMDGFETTQKLRSESEFKHTPIVALTALAMPNDRERCLAAGMDEYVTKPVHLRGLIKIIEHFLSNAKEVKS